MPVRKNVDELSGTHQLATPPLSGTVCNVCSVSWNVTEFRGIPVEEHYWSLCQHCAIGSDYFRDVVFKMQMMHCCLAVGFSN